MIEILLIIVILALAGQWLRVEKLIRVISAHNVVPLRQPLPLGNILNKPRSPIIISDRKAAEIEKQLEREQHHENW